ncbi:MAG: four helix bundle protein [Desulfobacteraceae bacterium]|nr:MAG: four helix bundle protein [Desulfobacteraceae bacterium]
MAQYEHLPIYREAFKFLINCETVVQHFPRYHKYTHGSDLRGTARTVIKLIIRANNLSDKEQVLEELRVTIEELKVIIRICKEVKAFKSPTDYMKKGDNVQLPGWLNFRSLRIRIGYCIH